jgi:hypothetical protein
MLNQIAVKQIKTLMLLTKKLLKLSNSIKFPSIFPNFTKNNLPPQIFSFLRDHRNVVQVADHKIKGLNEQIRMCDELWIGTKLFAACIRCNSKNLLEFLGFIENA